MINKYIIVFLILLCSIYLKLVRVDTLQKNPLLLILLFVNLIIFNKSELYGYILLICFIYYNYILNNKYIKGGNALFKGLNFAAKGIMPLGGKILETFTNLGANDRTESDNSEVHNELSNSDSYSTVDSANTDTDTNNDSDSDSDSEFDDEFDDDDDDDDEDF